MAPSIVDGGPGPEFHGSLWEYLQLGVRIDPSATAVLSLRQSSEHLAHLLSTSGARQPGRKYLSWSFRDLEEASLRIAAHLHSHDIGPSDVVVVFLDASIECVIFLWAALRLGAAFVPLDPSTIANDEELNYFVSTSGATTVVVKDADMAAAFDRKVKSANRFRHKLFCDAPQMNQQNGSKGLEFWDCLAHVCANSDQLPPVHRPEPDHPVMIMYTSGTTSRPKGCVLRAFSAFNWCDGPRSNAATLLGHWTSSVRYIVTTPPFRPTFLSSIFAVWRSGGAIVIAGPELDPLDLLCAMANSELAITYACLVPRFLHTLFALPEFVNGKYVPCALKLVYVSGEVVNRSFLELCQRNLRAENVWSGWGMTEGVGISTWAREGDTIRFTETEGGIASIGRATAGTKVKICIPGTKEPNERGERGDLHISRVSFIREYIDGRSPETFYEDKEGTKWFITGDCAMMDEDDCIYVLGRNIDIIRQKDRALLPIVFESSLMQHQTIESAQVVGAPHPSQGQIAIAVITRTSESAVPDGDVPGIVELNDRLRKEAGPGYELAEIYELKQLGLEDWPRNASSKIIKAQVKEAVLNLRNHS